MLVIGVIGWLSVLVGVWLMRPAKGARAHLSRPRAWIGLALVLAGVVVNLFALIETR